jgi:hypothetical protein
LTQPVPSRSIGAGEAREPIATETRGQILAFRAGAWIGLLGSKRTKQGGARSVVRNLAPLSCCLPLPREPRNDERRITRENDGHIVHRRGSGSEDASICEENQRLAEAEGATAGEPTSDAVSALGRQIRARGKRKLSHLKRPSQLSFSLEMSGSGLSLSVASSEWNCCTSWSATAMPLQSAPTRGSPTAHSYQTLLTLRPLYRPGWKPFTLVG